MNSKAKRRNRIKPLYKPGTLGNVIRMFEQKIILKQVSFNQTADAAKQRIAHEIQYLRNNWLNDDFDFKPLAMKFGSISDTFKMICEIIPASDVRIPKEFESEIIHQILDDYKTSLGTDRYSGNPLSHRIIEARYETLTETARMIGY